MGEFNTVGLEDIIDAFSRREAATVEAVPKMLKAGADVLIEAQRAEAQAMGLNETGGFINSIKATDVKGDDTEKYVEIYPQGRAMQIKWVLIYRLYRTPITVLQSRIIPCWIT